MTDSDKLKLIKKLNEKAYAFSYSDDEMEVLRNCINTIIDFENEPEKEINK